MVCAVWSQTVRTCREASELGTARLSRTRPIVTGWVVWAKSYGLLHLAGNICYERSGECIDLDLLELLYYTYVDCEVRRIDAPLYSPHAVLRTLPLLEHADSIEYSYSRWPIDGG
jgi:hypothetical protein